MKKARKNKSITAYPLFPAFVALWFAALFGLSSLAVGVANLERAVGAAELHLLIPAAAPPLGMTARALIAMGMAVSGGLVGFVVGHLLARRNRPATPVEVRLRDTHPDAPVRRPISAHEEFGDVEDYDPEAVRDMQALRAARAAAASELDLALPAFIADDLPPTIESPIEPPAKAVFGMPLGEAAERIASDHLEGLSPVELLERLAIAMQQRLDRRAAEAGAEPDSSVTLFPSPVPPIEPAEPVSDETEKALRDALAALQRMTGTG